MYTGSFSTSVDKCFFFLDSTLIAFTWEMKRKLMIDLGRRRSFRNRLLKSIFPSDTVLTPQPVRSRRARSKNLQSLLKANPLGPCYYALWLGSNSQKTKHHLPPPSPTKTLAIRVSFQQFTSSCFSIYVLLRCLWEKILKRWKSIVQKLNSWSSDLRNVCSIVFEGKKICLIVTVLATCLKYSKQISSDK